MRLTWPLLCLASLATGSAGFAQDFTLSAEPAAAFSLDEPQATRFNPGGHLAIRPGLKLSAMSTLQLSYGVFYLPAGEGFDDAGLAQLATGGLRLRPFAPRRSPEEQLSGLFLDGNVGYVRTGALDRFGFDAGVGYGMQPTPRLSLGPVLRYSQIVQPDSLRGVNAEDAQLLSLGLNVTVGSGMEATPTRASEAGHTPTRVDVDHDQANAQPCADYDRDGVCDDVDQCKTQIGPPATMGCPIDPCSGAPLRVLVQFQYDSAALPAPVAGDLQTMDPVLEAVVAAITQDPSCRVCIKGNASEEGSKAYNLTLSQERASAVQGYMVARGLSDDRMPTIGLGARCQLVPESSRSLNRRVDFQRLQEGEACSSVCAE